MRRGLVELGNYLELVLILALGLCIILVLGMFIRRFRYSFIKRNQEFTGESIYKSVIASSENQAHLLIEHETRNPLFLSDSLSKLLDVKAERIKNNPENILDAMQEDGKQFWKDYESWNRMQPLQTTFYDCKKEQWIKLIVSKCSDENYDLFEFYNVSEFQKERDELERALKEAREESDSKLTFLSRMSHEIRTPMNGIIGLLSFIEKESMSPKAKQYVEQVQVQSQYLLSLLNDILDMSRIDNGKLQLEEKPFDLFVVANDIRSLFQHNIESKGLKFTLNLIDFDKHIVIGDCLRLKQVIANFLSNAQKFTSKGEICVTFRAMMQSEEELNFMIQVHDTGIGMNPEFVKRIFNPFEQESTDTAHHYGGSGLGMAITNRIVHLMGGEILVNTQPNKGTDFSVYLNMPLSKEQYLFEEQQVEDSLIKEYSLNGKNILMAEDTQMNAMIAEMILSDMGAKVEIAQNGKEALEKFESNPENYYDFILMDIRMPVMDGLEATKAIRKLERKDAITIPIFALSADAFVEDQRRSIDAGMDGHFTKPIDFNKIEKEIVAFMLKRNQ
ncbi:hypothetical protein P261_01703 [Lachnospiraceae bacterium TWA4]|nr:hypothetical protein P261_01703 [Lachnospiraceae bacterium TWA4]